uniref:RING-type E3 ubiquitin transferase n=1 Tax=Periophthalmus magnuspinnatus TaxID=409849 RepID=A0A3B4BM24_9GOBI
MDPPGGGDERRRQAERLRREEAYYHFINELSEDEYRLMRDSNLLGTPEVTAEELRQRLDGAKERVSSQPPPEHPAQNTSSGEQQGPGGESSNGDSLLEWLNTFRRTGNATRSGQSGNQTWRAVSRTNPNSGEFRFSLEININHDQPEPGEHNDISDHSDLPVTTQNTASIRTSSAFSSHRPSLAPRPAPYPTPRPPLSRRMHTRRTRSNSTALSINPSPFLTSVPPQSTGARRGSSSHSLVSLQPAPAPYSEETVTQSRAINAGIEHERDNTTSTLDCPLGSQDTGSQVPSVVHETRGSRTRSRARTRRAAVGSSVSTRVSRRSRSPLQQTSVSNSSAPSINSDNSFNRPAQPSNSLHSALLDSGGEQVTEPTTVSEPVTETVEREGESPLAGNTAVRRHPTIMLDLQVRRIRPGENRDRDSIASRTRSRARVAENTVTFESDSGGFRRTISRSERAGIRTYVSTIRIPLRRISETGLGEPNSTALRSILRQIMTGFGELSSLMETEADSESVAPSHTDAVGINSPESQHSIDRSSSLTGTGGTDQERPRLSENDEEDGDQSRLPGGVVSTTEGRVRDTNNLVENGTLPIEDDEHPRGLTKEQIDNLVTRTYGQASLEGEMGRACSVCINEYAQGNKLRRLPCSHEFHIHCIDRWLSENNTCPICRQPILGVHHD